MVACSRFWTEPASHSEATWRRARSITSCTVKSMNRSPTKGETPAQLIDSRIKELDDWRGAMLSKLRSVIKQTDAKIVEEWKWNVPVWSREGILCTGETYKNAVKLTFAKGAFLDDPSGLFNSSLEGNVRRAIDFHEGDKVNTTALKALVRAAVKHNVTQRK